MGLRRLKRSAFAGWLAVVALSIQALIPALLAAEISVADAGSGGLFALCAFGHLHVANHHEEGSGSSHHSDDDEANAVCPICLALLASPAFTAAPAVSLPLPQSRPTEVIATADTALAVARLFDAYRSRAPPLA